MQVWAVDSVIVRGGLSNTPLVQSVSALVNKALVRSPEPVTSAITPAPLLELAYGYMPLVWTATLVRDTVHIFTYVWVPISSIHVGAACYLVEG